MSRAITYIVDIRNKCYLLSFLHPESVINICHYGDLDKCLNCHSIGVLCNSQGGRGHGCGGSIRGGGVGGGGEWGNGAVLVFENRKHGKLLKQSTSLGTVFKDQRVFSRCCLL